MVNWNFFGGEKNELAKLDLQRRAGVLAAYFSKKKELLSKNTSSSLPSEMEKTTKLLDRLISLDKSKADLKKWPRDLKDIPEHIDVPVVFRTASRVELRPFRKNIELESPVRFVQELEKIREIELDSRTSNTR